MNIGAKAFSARVQLPCRLFCGPDHGLRMVGTAVSIDTGSAVLVLPDDGVAYPKAGEVVNLELDLPMNADTSARCLAVRASVARVVAMRDGTRRMTVQFRKAAFKESERLPKKPPRVASGWEM
jgi:hypothetical protein